MQYYISQMNDMEKTMLLSFLFVGMIIVIVIEHKKFKNLSMILLLGSTLSLLFVEVLNLTGVMGDYIFIRLAILSAIILSLSFIISYVEIIRKSSKFKKNFKIKYLIGSIIMFLFMLFMGYLVFFCGFYVK